MTEKDLFLSSFLIFPFIFAPSPPLGIGGTAEDG